MIRRTNLAIVALAAFAPIALSLRAGAAADQHAAKPAASAKAAKAPHGPKAEASRTAPASSAEAPSSSAATPASSASAAPATPAEPPQTEAPPPAPAAGPPIPIAAGDSSSCADATIAQLVHSLKRWERHYRDAEKQAIEKQGCAASNVVCFDRLGELLKDELPARAVAGSSISAYVIGPTIDTSAVSVAISVKGSVSQSSGAGSNEGTAASAPAGSGACRPSPAQEKSLRAALKPIAALGSQPGLEVLGIPSETSAGAELVGQWTAWEAAQRSRVLELASTGTTFEVPFGETNVSIDVTRTDRGGRSSAATKHYEIPIDNGRYHLELGLLIPFVEKGRRNVELNPPTGTQLRVDVQEDWRVTGAVMIDYFPFGRARGQVSSFKNCKIAGCYDNWLALQFGTGLDEPLKSWYFGLLFEPASGIGVSAGGAFLKGEFLPPGTSEGMILQSPSALQTDTSMMLRAYVGVTLTLDLPQTLDRGAIAAKLK
jgi:hypothetical protein